MDEPRDNKAKDAGTAFAKCPSCHYNVTGVDLPAVCSECGLQIDANATLFVPSGRIRIDSIYIHIFNAFILWLVLRSGFRATTSTLLQICSFICASFIVISATEFLVRRLRHPSPNEFLLLSPGRLFMRRKGHRDVSIQADDVSRVLTVEFTELVSIQIKDAKRPFVIPRFLWPKQMPLEEFAAQVEQSLIAESDAT